ncbi:MAG: FeoB-associated Cys-rich membrane protein [Brachymonas sp.]|nr:FeoB-associated Cys-rich membrane protein [Brachymonas sp.]
MQPTIDLSHESAFGWSEWAIVLAVLAIAGFYLWRKIFVKKGCGCSGCGKEKSCAIKPPQTPQQVDEKPIVLHK